MSVLLRFFLIALVLASGLPLAAADAYIKDGVNVEMRNGPSTNYLVRKYVVSGEKVTVLERNQDTGFTQVRTATGKTGWVRSDVVTNAKTISVKLDEALQSAADYQAQIDKLKLRLRDSGAIEAVNEQLQLQVTELQNKVDTLEQQNSRLSDVYYAEIAYSALGILLIGLIFGYFISRTSHRRKRNSGWR